MARKAITRALTVDVKDVFSRFIDEKRVLQKNPATIAGYAQTFKMFYAYLSETGVTDANKMSKDIIFGYISSIADKVKATTINHNLRNIRAVLFWGMANNEVPKFDIKMLSTQESPKPTYSNTQLKVLLAKPQSQSNFNTWRTWAIVNWVLATANRVLTLCSIRIKDVDFDGNTIILSHTKNKKSGIKKRDTAVYQNVASGCLR